jgi:signal transduction histidine kinase
MQAFNHFCSKRYTVVGLRMKQHFRFAPDILARLGEELIPNPEQGIVELVKNAYDADASTCVVELENVSQLGGKVVVRDDGNGMDIEDISNGWLVIGKSQKAQARERTMKYQRLPVGDKGLGRLAALRLGEQVTLNTVPVDEPNTSYSLNIDWEAFARAEVVEDVSFEVERSDANNNLGTEIIINNTKTPLNTYAVQRLARELILLADPFENRFGFYPRLIAPEFKEYEELVNNAYFEDAEFHLRAELDDNGRANAWLYDWKGNLLFDVSHSHLRESQYQAPAAQFDLWVFILDAQTFSTRKSSVGEVRNWLRSFGGVHLYHRGLRVRPYGDPGHDWLEMNLSRARSPEERPSTNTSIGKIVVDDPNDELVQKTDRLGFIESEEFNDLREFAIDAMNWMASRRLDLAEKRRERKRRQASTSTTKAKENLDKIIEEKLPEQAQKEFKQRIQNYERAVEKEAVALREDLQLYRTLATAGTTSAVFAHETSKPATLISKVAERIESVGKSELGDDYSRILSDPVELLRSVANSLLSFARFPLHLLKREKRRTGIVQVKDVIEDLIQLFQPFLRDARININFDAPSENVMVVGSIALIEAIITNLITNAINAFNTEGAEIENRQLLIRISASNENAIIRVMDNGPGIRGITLDEMWLPGRTTTSGGTGFGLTIVRDSVADLDGEVSAVANGELGGAEFIIVLPMVKAD